MINTLCDDIDTYTLREAEFSCNALVGFNFGDGHLHDRRMIEAVQKRCVVERSSWLVKEAIAEQPWHPNGPIRTFVHWSREDYQRVRHGTERPAPVAAAPALHPELVA
jgi:hypothetical protein